MIAFGLLATCRNPPTVLAASERTIALAGAEYKAERARQSSMRMRCEVFRSDLTPRRTTPAAPYHYTFSGLANVWLVGIEAQRCSRCDVEMPFIPRAPLLHRLLAAVLIERPGARTGFARQSNCRAACPVVRDGAR